MIKEGQKAPEWQAKDQDGNDRSSEEFLGQWLILYFYPKDGSPGCTKEACTIRDNYKELSEKANVLGVSSDSVESHKKFKQNNNLPFDLLSDPQKEIIEDYGANGLIFSKRVTFIIDPEGKVKKVFNNVSPERHALQILAVWDDMI